MGTIRFIAKVITERAESIKYHSTDGSIIFNSAKDIVMEAGEKIVYADYDPDEDTATDFDITFSLNPNDKTVVPLGISDFSNGYENPYFSFIYTLALNPIDSLDFNILDAEGNALYQSTSLAPVVLSTSKKDPAKNEAKEPLPSYPTKTSDPSSILEENWRSPSDYTQIGSYLICWDGFDNNEIYDSTRFNNKKLTAKITATRAGKKKSLAVEFYTHYAEVDWVDVRINRKTNRIDTTLRVICRMAVQKASNAGKTPGILTRHTPKTKFAIGIKYRKRL